MWEKAKDEWSYAEFPTSAMSFHSYRYVLPRPIRSVIVFAPMASSVAKLSPRVNPTTLAHELGRKLINVSHEGRETSPQNETTKGGWRDIMVYGLGLGIPSGEVGRRQAERLRLSPYI